MEQSKFIPPKKTKKTAKVEPVIPQDLQEKWGAVQACATTFNILQKGMFTHEMHPLVKASLVFLQKLHEGAIKDALLHPEACLIPELKEFQELQAKEAKDEQKQ